jgi:hypothetical protein
MANSSDESNVTLTLTRREAKALLLGLVEYIYIVEEGNIEELLDEVGWESKAAPINARQADALQQRIGSLLSL